MKRPRFEICQDRAGLWRWRLKAKNGRILAEASQGYRRRTDLLDALELIDHVCHGAYMRSWLDTELE